MARQRPHRVQPDFNGAVKEDNIARMERCAFDIGRGMCSQGGGCPYDDGCQQALECDRFAYSDTGVKTSAVSKQAAWEDVAAKARAIVATGGVEIVSSDANEIRAYVMSGQLDGEFPVTEGGPYEVILSKRTWDLRPNVGGWVQGYLCDCKWGFYNSGQPGNRWRGRFCSHAYAALLEANARARKDFTRSKAAMYGGKWNDRNFYMGTCATWRFVPYWLTDDGQGFSVNDEGLDDFFEGDDDGAFMPLVGVNPEYPSKEPDYVSKSGSMYWYTHDGVYRVSSHWGDDIGTCDWYIVDGNNDQGGSRDDRNGERCGFCEWRDFEHRSFTPSHILDGDGFELVEITPQMLWDGYVHYGGGEWPYYGEDVKMGSARRAMDVRTSVNKFVDRNGTELDFGDKVEFEGEVYEITGYDTANGRGYVVTPVDAEDEWSREMGELFLDWYDLSESAVKTADFSDFNIDDESDEVRSAFDELVDMLQSSSYEGLSSNLDAICQDPKLLQLLRMGFGSGEFADLTMDGSLSYVPVEQLNPMQNEIGLPNSLAYPLSGQADPEIYFQSTATIGGPIVTLNGTYVIDGHHRWSQLYMMNPDAAIEAVNFTCSNPDPEDALRVFQAAIAATHGTVPHSDGGVANVYAMSADQIHDWIDGEMVEDCELSIIWHTDAEDREGAIDYLVDNAMSLPQPDPSAPDRKYMPQTDELALETVEDGYVEV